MLLVDDKNDDVAYKNYAPTIQVYFGWTGLTDVTPEKIRRLIKIETTTDCSRAVIVVLVLYRI